MREIMKTISIPVDGKPFDFRLTKLDAFSGASLLRMISGIPAGKISAAELITCLPDQDLRALMTVCLEHAEVSLPAGWNPVMTRGEWTWPEVQHDTAVCLKLTIEEVLWTLKEMMKGEVYAELLGLVEDQEAACEDGLSYSDVMILLTQYKSALVKFRRNGRMRSP